MAVNEITEEKTELTDSGFDFSQIEKKLKDEEALKNTSWQELLREYEPWLITEFINHFLECTPDQQARWKETVNRCHERMRKRTRMFMILFAVLTAALLAESFVVKELTFPIRILLLVLAGYCGMNCWSHWLLSRKFTRIE